MRAIDIIIIVLLLFGAYSGYKKGLLMELIAILAFFIALIGALKFMHWGVEILQRYINSFHQFIPLISFLILFVGIIILINVLGRVLKNILDMTLLGSIDNLGGAIIGIVKWGFGISVLILVIEAIEVEIPPEMSENTFLYPKIAGFAPMVFDYISDIFPFIRELFEKLKDMIS